MGTTAQISAATQQQLRGASLPACPEVALHGESRHGYVWSNPTSVIETAAGMPAFRGQFAKRNLDDLPGGPGVSTS